MKKHQMSDAVSKRLGEFLSILNSSPLEEVIGIEKFDAIVEQEEHEKADSGPDAVKRKVRYALNLAQRELGGGRSIVIDDHSVKVTAFRATTFDRRCQSGLAEKTIIADTFLYWLFGSDDYPLPGNPDETEFLAGDPTLIARLTRKRDTFREMSIPTMLIDSGSTTYKFTERFLATRRMPITVQVAAENAGTRRGQATHPRLITPTVVTNSIPIAMSIGESMHHKVLNLKVVGGTELNDRRSICGEGAALWLKTCQAAGVMATVDLAIIGATGYLNNYVGSLPALGCHEYEQASLKATMLDLASNGLRVCLLESRKLIGSEFNCCFAPVTRSSLDLIVVDDGCGKDTSAQAVKDFCKRANEEGVGVMVARKR